MSGICGIIEPSCLPDGKMRIEKMLDAMEHRGRDARGTAFPEENIFLGCVLLNVFFCLLSGFFVLQRLFLSVFVLHNLLVLRQKNVG